MTTEDTDTRTIGRRWLAMLDEIGDLTPDKTHAIGFKYVSIQKLTASLRKAAVKHGLVLLTQIEGSTVELTVINADAPEQVWHLTYPVVQDDKGWAYSVKYAWARTVLMGDDEDDEVEGVAGRPPEARTALPQDAATRERAAVSGPWHPARTSSETDGPFCPDCGDVLKERLSGRGPWVGHMHPGTCKWRADGTLAAYTGGQHEAEPVADTGAGTLTAEQLAQDIPF